MSYRKFAVLLNGFSNDSLYVLNYQAMKDGKKAVDVTEDQADRLLDDMFK